MTDIGILAQALLSGFCDIGGRAAIESLVSRDIRVSGVEGLDIHGSAELLRFHNMVWCQLDALSAEPALVLRDPPWVSLVCLLTLRERRSGLGTTDRLQVTMRIDRGRVAEVIAFVDFLALFEAIGRLPPRILDRCLTGEVMRAL